jgi:hypothetical protein
MSQVADLKRDIKQMRQKRLDHIQKICFCHVPKCAGTALVAALRNYYSLTDRILFPNFYMDLEASSEAAAATSESMTQVRQDVLAYVLATGRYKYAGGHVPCRPKLVETFRDRWNLITVLRDPVERWISGYVYDRYKTESWSKTEMEIEEYLRSDAGIVSGRAYLWYFSNMPNDASVRDFEPYVEEAVENLRHFALVGAIENMPALVKDFERVFGKPLKISSVNRSPNPGGKQDIRQNAALMDHIREVCRPDTMLYTRLLEIGLLPAPQPRASSN